MSDTPDQIKIEDRLTEHRVERPNGKLYVRDYAGEGPAFVLMHGFPDNLHIYDYLVPHLVAAGRRVVTFDFLGFGNSDKPMGPHYSFPQQLGDLVAVVDALGLEKIIPVAHDSSGTSAVNFALDHPDRTASVIILNAVYAETPSVRYPELIDFFASPNLRALSGAVLQAPETFAFILNFQRAKFQDVLEERHRDRYASFLGPLIDGNFRQQPSAGLAFAHMTAQLLPEATANARRLGELKALDIPFRFIWGEADPYLTVQSARELMEHMASATIKTIPAGHWVQIDEPELTAAAMLEA